MVANPVRGLLDRVVPRVCVLSSHLFCTFDYLWTHQPGSHRRKVAPDFSTLLLLRYACVCACVFFPFILGIKFVGRTSRGHTGGRSHRIFHPPSFCGARLNFSREKDSAAFLSVVDREVEFLIVLHSLAFFFFFFFVRKNCLPRSNSCPNVSEGYEVTSELPMLLP